MQFGKEMKQKEVAELNIKSWKLLVRCSSAYW